MTTRRIFLIVLLSSFFAFSLANIEEIRKKCQSVDGLKSCGQCLKQHPDCAWCSDVDSKVLRCDHKSSFTSTCASVQGATGKSEVNIPNQHNYPIGVDHPHYRMPIQITPQQAYLKLKPGDTLQVPFTYKHGRPSVEVQDFALQTSDLRPIGLDIKFEIDCHGEKVIGEKCKGIREGEEIKFTAIVSLKECKAAGDVAASIGVYGYNMVSAIFVTPLCACECEKVKNIGSFDFKCNAAGRLVCGQCVCEKGYGGSKCQCDLAKHSVKTAEELDNKCRRSPNELICSGKGLCDCGQCKCNANFIQGRFCECDSTVCPKDRDGRLCSGRGACDCGKCHCEEGFDGDDCGCESDESSCKENGQICSNNGKCVCGKCACKDGYTGSFCTISQASNAKDGTTLNENDFNENNVQENDGDLLPNETSKDEAVEAHEKSEQDREAQSSAFKMQHLLSALVGLLIVKLGLILA